MLMDEWGIDFVAIGAQKALAGPNGISAVGISSRGWEFLASNEHAPRNSILSLLDLRCPHTSSAPLRVPANIPVLEARALIEALTLVEQEGLEVVNHRHQLASTAAIAGITALGLEPWQRKESGYSPLTTTVRIPQSDSNLRINEPIGIVAPGDGELYGKLLRINHFGANANQQSIEQAITTLAELVHQDPANAIAVQRSIWGMKMGAEFQQDQTFEKIYIAGIADKRFDITISNGRFSSIRESITSTDQPNNPAKDVWISPGIIDLHTHLAWTDFDHADQLKRADLEVEVLQAQAFEATLRAGVTTVRDAGGLQPSTVQHIGQHYNQPLRVHTCGDMLGAHDARGIKYLESRVTEIINSGASWIKILATGDWVHHQIPY